MNGLLFLQCFLACVCLCQGQAPANGTGRERGVLFSSSARYDDTIHLIHLHFMPYYETIRRPASVPGWQFSIPELDFLSLDIDYRDKTLFLFDRDSRSLLAATGYKAPVTEGSFSGPIYYLSVGVSDGSVQIAYDWMSKTLYWVDSALQMIFATSGNMTKYESTDFIHYNKIKIISDKDLEHPEGVAVDPLSGYIFFSDNGKHPKIERANLDGSERITLLRDGVGIPESLEVDIKEHKLYWVDQLKQTIEFMDYNGNGLTRLRLKPNTLWSDLAIFRDMVVAVDHQFGRAYFLNKTSGADLTRYIEFKKEFLHGVLIYNIENQPLKQLTGPSCEDLQCQHLCISTPTNPKCACFEGNELIADGRTCIEKLGNHHKAIVFALERYICLADIRALNNLSPFFGLTFVFQTFQSPTTATTTTTDANANTTSEPSTPYNPLMDPDNSIKMIDLDNRKRVVYFATEADNIYARVLDANITNYYREFIVSSSGKINGMVYDWVNQNNLYWIDGSSNVLYVVDVTTKTAVVQGSIGIDGTPSNLVMLYRQRRLAWWMHGSGSKLVTSNLDGGDKQVIVSGRPDVQSLAVDDEKEMFYWIEGLVVKSTSFNNNNNPGNIQTVTNTFENYDGIEVLLQYKNLLMWAGPYGGPGTAIESFNLDVKTEGTLGRFDTPSLFTDIKMLDTALINDDLSNENQCAYQNGKCEQTCTMKYTPGTQPVKQCGCTLGYTLHADQKRCVSDYVTTDFVLVTDITFGRIYQIDLENDRLYALNYRESAIYNSILYDRMNNYVYWSEAGNNNVYSANLNGTELVLRDTRAYGSPGDFALDETTGILYYAENNKPFDGFVRVLTPQGFGFLFIENTLRYQDSIAAIDVHPQKGWLFMAIRSGLRSSYILRSNLDGTNIVRFNLTTSTTYPTFKGLVINHYTDEIYVTEGEEDKIYKCDLTLRSCEWFLTDTGAAMQQLTSDGIYIYYTSFNAHHVKRVKISDKSETELGKSVEMGKLSSISVYKTDSKNIQKESEGCKGRNGLGDCSTICFPTETGRTCACEAGVKLLADNRTCENVHQCAPSFTEANTGGRVVQLAPECLRYVNESCHYICADSYKPVNDMTLLCTQGGWDRQSQQLCESSPCQQSIPNGRIGTNCEYQVGVACGFTCNQNQGYYRHPNVNQLTCKPDGSWDSNGTPACINTQCSTSLSNGDVDICDRRLGSTCGYTCRSNYRKTTDVRAIVCELQNGQPIWNQTDNLCIEILCPNNVANGVVSNTCKRKVGSSCKYTCAEPFLHDQNVTSVICTGRGTWNQSIDLCLAPLPGVSSASSGTSEGTKVGIGVGVGIAVLVLIVLVLLAVFCRGRLANCGKGKDQSSAAFTNDPIDGIENPGYLTADIRVTEDNSGYDQAVTARNPNYKKDDPYTTIGDNGTVRSGQSFYYGNDTLSDQKEIDSPNKGGGVDPSGVGVYVAADDWLEQQKSSNGKY